MNYNIDDFKINNNKIYINGWAHFEKYKIIIQSGEENKYLDNYTSRYDINMLFHEKIEDNLYGFKQEVEFNNKIKKVNIYIITNDEKILIRTIDNRKIINYIRNIKKILGKVKRIIMFLWREYHFLVPPKMWGKYFKIIFNRKQKLEVFNPEIDSEYNTWLTRQTYLKDDNKKKNITIVGTEKHDYIDYVIENNLKKIISKINTDYVCLIEGNIKFINYFYSELNSVLDKNYDLIYFDNDLIRNNKYCSPNLKPDWSRDTLLGVNYIGNCIVIKKSILKKYADNNSSIYQILLNLIGKTNNIMHISKIMYHDYGNIKNEIKEVEKYLEKNNIKAKVKKNTDGITNTISYEIIKKPLVSIIIPTKDHADILDNCLKSIYEKTTYKNFEIILIDNNSTEKETFNLIKKYEKKSNFKSKRIECEFNYSYLNNEAVKISKGDFIVLLNNDIELISGDWLEKMLGYAQQPHIGAVGAKLIFEDNTIQHAGIIMGKGGLAGHAHYGKDRNFISHQFELKIPYDYSACTAACLMVEKKKYKEVNGLEEKLKVAFNDVDFNLKLLEKGYNNIFLPNVMLYHYESKSRGLDTTPEKQKRFVQEWSFITNKWDKYIKHDKFYNDNFSKDYDYMLK